jgi:hypothetical protein
MVTLLSCRVRNQIILFLPQEEVTLNTNTVDFLEHHTNTIANYQFPVTMVNSYIDDNYGKDILRQYLAKLAGEVLPRHRLVNQSVTQRQE